MKGQMWILTILVVAALVMAGCGLDVGAQPSAAPQAQAAASSVATDAPAVANLAPTNASVALAAPTSAPASPAQAAAPAAAPADPAADATLSAVQAAYQAIYARMNPSVVLIQVVVPATSSGSSGSGSTQGQQLEQALGSGFIWDKDGHIITNNHVVAGATNISVTFYDGTTVSATVVGTDPDSDLAVIKVDVPASQLQPVTLADSTKLAVGQLVIAIGNPFGEQNTMTTGIISALGRTLPVGDSSSSGPSYTIPDVIQTDASINPGNSGGVLLDTQGHVVGVTSAIESPAGQSAGIGFAIPSLIVQKVVPILMTSGHVDHPWLGISGTDMTPDLAKAMGLDASQRGALIEQVDAGSPAGTAGLQGSTKTAVIFGQQVDVGGDVITAIDGQPVKVFDDLTAYLAISTTVGQTVTLGVVRDGKQQDVKVTLQARPDTTQAASDSGGYLGITGVTVTADIASAMSLAANVQGVLIQQVAPGSPADQAGLQGSTKSVTISGNSVLVGGDIITAFGGQAVTSMDDLAGLLQQTQPGDIVSMTVVRGGQQGRVRVQLDQQPTSELEATRD